MSTTAPLTTPTSNEQAAIATLVTAFAADPVIRWFLPETGRYLAWFPEIVAVIGADAFAAGTVDCTAEATATSIWLPPGAVLDEDALGKVLEHCIDPQRSEHINSFLVQMNDHHPDEPVWHLFFIGVDPCHQGRSVGSTLLEQGLGRADADGHAAYLEASTPRNRALYERYGFEAVGEIRAEDSPPAWPMYRPARRSTSDQRGRRQP